MVPQAKPATNGGGMALLQSLEADGAPGLGFGEKLGALATCHTRRQGKRRLGRRRRRNRRA
eukprot:352594-Chlamydomonas_euryale.AAC.1